MNAAKPRHQGAARSVTTNHELCGSPLNVLKAYKPQNSDSKKESKEKQVAVKRTVEMLLSSNASPDKLSSEGTVLFAL
jgi:hypothetical protein